MDLDDFSNLCKRKIDEYYKIVENAVSEGRVEQNGRVVDHVYYPTTILCIESEGKALSVELVGLTKNRKAMKIKKRNNITVQQLTLIDRNKKTNVAFCNIVAGNKFSQLLFSDEESRDFQKTQSNPLSEKFQSCLILGGEIDHLFDFNDESISCLVSECMLSYVSNKVLRRRYIHRLMMFSSKLSEADFLREFDNFVYDRGGEVFGVHFFPEGQELPWVKASYLMNLVLNDKIHETTIGDYLNDHSDILLNALGYENIVYEPTLEWLEKTEDNPDSYINPDALLQRLDGYYDICDFKKGLIKRKSLTKGERRRRRFVDDVNEGLAQLDNYEEYFKFTKNAQNALERFGVEVDMPRKILIVGNLENSKKEEVEQALRGRSNTLVIDYDSLVSSYIGSIK